MGLPTPVPHNMIVYVQARVCVWHQRVMTITIALSPALSAAALWVTPCEAPLPCTPHFVWSLSNVINQLMYDNVPLNRCNPLVSGWVCRCIGWWWWWWWWWTELKTSRETLGTCSSIREQINKAFHPRPRRRKLELGRLEYFLGEQLEKAIFRHFISMVINRFYSFSFV